MNGFTITPDGPFSLTASTRFLEGFAPAAHTPGPAGHLHLAFTVERDGWAPAGVCVRQQAPGADVTAEVEGRADPDAVRAQVARILSLDVDGTGFAGVGRRDPAVAELQARYPGLRPVCFWSPYEAAAWALISHRIRIVQASRVKARMAEQLGTPFELHGETVHAFPGPSVLAGLEEFPGLFGRKPEWLRALGTAALDGELDGERLRGLPRDQALTELRSLPGVGPFSADLILLRGAGDPDGFPSSERRLAKVMAATYDLGADADPARLTAIAEAWRPYRTWVSLLFRVRLEDETGEIAGRRPPATTEAAGAA
jgi:DNA-3-methyladenine glycosylase II